MSLQRQAVVNARLFDSVSGTLRPHTTLVIEGERIVAVTQEPMRVDDAKLIDAGGRVVLPGLIDAHVHVVAASHDLVGLALQPASLVGAMSSHIMRGMLQRGFTTVRDAAGADFGLQEAVARACTKARACTSRAFQSARPAAMPTCAPKVWAGEGRAPACSAAAPASVWLAPLQTAWARCVARCASKCATAPTTSRSWPVGCQQPDRPDRRHAVQR